MDFHSRNQESITTAVAATVYLVEVANDSCDLKDRADLKMLSHYIILPDYKGVWTVDHPVPMYRYTAENSQDGEFPSGTNTRFYRTNNFY